MYKALIKNEYRLQHRVIVVLLAAGLIGTVGSIGLMLLKIPFLSQLGVLAGVVSIFAIGAGIPVYLLFRYYQSMYGREGYMTQVVPAQASTLYWAKYTWAFALTLISMLISLALGVGLAMAGFVSAGGSISQFWTTVGEVLGEMGGTPIIVLSVWLVVGVAINVAQFGWIVSFGMESRFQQFGLGGPVLVWLANYLVIQLTMVAAMFLIPLAVTPDFSQIVRGNLAAELFQSGGTEVPSVPIGFVPVLFASLPIYIVWTINSIKKHTSLR